MSKTYGVTLPVTGIIYVEVEAESEKEAIEKALSAEGCEWPKTPDEWEAHSQIVRGNVFSGMQNNASAEEI